MLDGKGREGRGGEGGEDGHVSSRDANPRCFKGLEGFFGTITISF